MRKYRTSTGTYLKYSRACIRRYDATPQGRTRFFPPSLPLAPFLSLGEAGAGSGLVISGNPLQTLVVVVDDIELMRKYRFKILW